MTNENILTFFSKVFYTKKLNINCEKFVKNLKNLKYIEAGNRDNLDVENITSTSMSYKVLESKNFLELKYLILKEFNFFKNNYLFYTNNDFNITSSWVAKSTKNQSSNYHCHKNSFYSGIIYLQTDKNCGGVSFENYYNTNNFLIIPSKYNLYNANQYTINVENGLLLFFPSEIHHKVLKNNSDIDRYSVAFNIMPSGKIGVSDSAIEIKI